MRISDWSSDGGASDLRTGIDLGPYVVGSMLKTLPKSDALHLFYKADHPLNALMQKMIKDGYTGRKGKGGFYRARGKEALDLKTGEYRATQRASLESAKVAKKGLRSEEHTSELQSLMRTSYAVFCLKKKPTHTLAIPITHSYTTSHHNT